MKENAWIKNNLRQIIFYVVFFLFILAFSTTARNYDYDFWARLVAGMGFVQTGHVLKQDFLSYTPTHTWFDHEWGSGVIFYLTQHFFSAGGIIILQAVLIFLVYLVMTKIIELRTVKTTTPYNFLFYYFSFIAMSYLLNDPIRCQLFSFLFFTLFLYILELSRNGKNKPLYLLPFLMIIWNNVHGGCVSGIGLIALYIIGEFLNKKPVKKYIYSFIATILVLVINPWGFKYLKFLFIANTMPRADVVEWWGLFSKFLMFRFMKFKIYAFILLLFEFFAVLKNKTFNIDKTKFLVVIVTLYLAIIHMKLIPFSVITIVVFFYDDFYDVFNSWTKGFFEKIAIVKEVVVYSLILIFVASNINSKIFEPRLDFSRYPLLPIEFIKINNIKGKVFINFGYGSYAAYKLYPNNKIFIDGRYEEVYFDDLMLLLNKFYKLKPDWDEIFKKYPPDVIVIEKFYPVSKVLRNSKDWKEVFEDNNFLVLVDSKMPEKKYINPSLDINYYKKTLFDTDIKFMLQSKHER